MTKYVDIPEINELFYIADLKPDFFKVIKLNEVQVGETLYPIYGLKIGADDPKLPTLGLFGGVHGLERIGSQVIISYLSTLAERLQWDQDLRDEFKTRRIVAIPIVNPWGIKTLSRSNANGVDLMRNAPVEADNATFLVGGHRISNHLPWYRGKSLEVESSTLIDFVKAEMFESKYSLALDFHSGFGVKDQIWYPWAKSTDPFPYMPEFNKLKELFEKTYPYHVYKIEGQSMNYTTHGDLWDYALLEQMKLNNNKTFIPLTLELGSWNWVKKNPIQFFSMFGLFNPIKKHRYSRTMRRHIYLIDFLLKAIAHRDNW
tara:strand:+ start:186587 stop:187534 length:948 start_codon:yes stop_codon:yes gene_type:complete